jgi:hypothetical protein
VSVLVMADIGSADVCTPAISKMQLPKWLGCLLRSRENLAGGLIGAGGTILAGWVAWLAVQKQINSARELAAADRVEVERLLSSYRLRRRHGRGMEATCRASS